MSFESVLRTLHPTVPITEKGDLISKEYRLLLANLFTGSSTTTTTGGVSLAAFTDLSSQLATLQDSLDALTKRVKKLEGGYQS